MRLSRPMAAAMTSCTLTVALGAAGPAIAGPPAAPVSAAAPASPVTVTISPADRLAMPGSPGPQSTAYCEKNYKIACYEPGQIQQAYGIPALLKAGISGKGQTIVIVESYGSPTIGHDLAVFDKQFRLPAPPSLRIIAPAGKIPAYTATPDRVNWAGEATLDVEYAHVMAPGARILLVETPVSETEGTAGFPQIEAAEKYVISHHLGSVISQSFNATEQTFPSRKALMALRSAYIEAARDRVTVLAASGDSGATNFKLDQTAYYTYPVTAWPATDSLVTAIGGTQLHLNASGGRTAPDNVWNDTRNAGANSYINSNSGPNPLAAGGGKSVMFSRPGYQNGVRNIVGARRGIPDVSMSAACDGAVDVYQSFPGKAAGWYPTCGTSVATPLFAGVVALADQVAGHPLGLINPALYTLAAKHAPGIVDIKKGSNTVSFSQGGQTHTVTGFAARPGYNLASGVGTIYAPLFVRELASAAGRGYAGHRAAVRQRHVSRPAAAGRGRRGHGGLPSGSESRLREPRKAA
ncbi:MAG TPA: S53 family peptidase [Streptosporangiaceae bacterium]|nr:S53 family peptidase [Streptosporangiaceae bacterium]